MTDVEEIAVAVAQFVNTYVLPIDDEYDGDVEAAGGDALPSAWFEQLAEGGRLVAPRADAKRGAQQLVVVDRTPRGFVQSEHESVLFVPLKSGLD